MIPWLKKTFIPHKGNNHHPHFWRNGSVALVLGIIVLTEMAILAEPFMVFKRESFLSAVLPGVILSLTNSERSTNAAQPLVENPTLSEAARLKAEDMANRGYFSHYTPEGLAPWYWLDKVGYKYLHAGENLAVNFSDSKDVVDAWMHSPTHRANIVKQIYSEIGIGMAEGMYQGRSTIFVVQFFGVPGTKDLTPESPLISSVTSSTTKPKINRIQERPLVSTTTATRSLALASTTSQVQGVEVDTSEPIQLAQSNVMSNFIASPHQNGRIILFLLLGLVFAALLLTIFHPIKTHHPRIIFVASVLVLIIVISLLINKKTLQERLYIGQSDFSAIISK